MSLEVTTLKRCTQKVTIFTMCHRKVTTFTRHHQKVTTFIRHHQKVTSFTRHHQKVTTFTRHHQKVTTFTRHRQKVTSPVFCFTRSTIYTQAALQTSVQHCRKRGCFPVHSPYLSTLFFHTSIRAISLPLAVGIHPLQPPAYGFLQFPVSFVMVLQQTLFSKP